jgi:hypothetical protein
MNWYDDLQDLEDDRDLDIDMDEDLQSDEPYCDLEWMYMVERRDA